MFSFKDIIGQEAAKQRLIQEVQEGRIPHAQLFCGPAGVVHVSCEVGDKAHGDRVRGQLIQSGYHVKID